MGLEAQPPVWVVETELDGHVSMSGAVEAVHWLQEEVLERKTLEVGRGSACLGIDQFQFFPAVF